MNAQGEIVFIVVAASVVFVATATLITQQTAEPAQIQSQEVNQTETQVSRAKRPSAEYSYTNNTPDMGDPASFGFFYRDTNGVTWVPTGWVKK